MMRESVHFTAFAPKRAEDSNGPSPQGPGVVQVANGVCFGPWPVAGKTIRFVRENLATPYNIHPGAVAVLNGEVVTDDAALQPGDTLAFDKMGGSN
jgi:hypothetical protein